MRKIDRPKPEEPPVAGEGPPGGAGLGAGLDGAPAASAARPGAPLGAHAAIAPAAVAIVVLWRISGDGEALGPRATVAHVPPSAQPRVACTGLEAKLMPGAAAVAPVAAAASASLGMLVGAAGRVPLGQFAPPLE